MITFINPTARALVRGAVIVPAGDMRAVPADAVLPTDRQIDGRYFPAVESADEAAQPSSSVDLGNVQALAIPALTAALSGLSDAELAELEALEQADEKPRQGALSAIAEMRLTRANGGNEGLQLVLGGDVEEIAESASLMSAENLQRLRALEAESESPRAEVLEVIDKAIAVLGAGEGG
ncbi:MAG: hypothetical protein AAF499_14610 [Pseudomonadota bacterium]